MSETRDKRRRTDLDLFVLALVADGISTPYELQKAAGLSQGATIPTLRRLLKEGFVEQASLDHRTVQQMARDGVIPAYPLGKVCAKPGASSLRKFMSGCSAG
jgi:hypothetical protein